LCSMLQGYADEVGELKECGDQMCCFIKYIEYVTSFA